MKNKSLLSIEKNIINWEKTSHHNYKKARNSTKKEFDTESLYHEKYLRTKINLVREKSTQIFTIIERRLSKYLSINDIDWFSL